MNQLNADLKNMQKLFEAARVFRDSYLKSDFIACWTLGSRKDSANHPVTKAWLKLENALNALEH